MQWYILSWVTVLLLSFNFNMGHAQDAQQKDLPQHVYFKTPTESFTHEWVVALRDGKLWIKPYNPRLWYHIGEEGRPDILPEEETIQVISADGDNLIFVSSSRQVYYAKFSSIEWSHSAINPMFAKMEWTSSFGRAGGIGIIVPPIPILNPQHLYVPDHYFGLSISHRGHLVKGYEDIIGNFHPNDFGVTTLYLMAQDGLNIYYTDPWLPAHFNRMIDHVENEIGRFRAVGFSASASTLFMINQAGEMYTCLADYDTIGENLYFVVTDKYSFSAGEENRGHRTLPGEDWIKQPAIQGKITHLITILQTGRGNAGRELRVEGVDHSTGAERTGYFSKPVSLINPETHEPYSWIFVETGEPIYGKFLTQNPDRVPFEQLWGEKKGNEFQGVFHSSKLPLRPLAANLMGFHEKKRQAWVVVHHPEGDVQMPIFTYRLEEAAPWSGIHGILKRPMEEQFNGNERLKTIYDKIFGEKDHLKIKIKVSSEKITIGLRPFGSPLLQFSFDNL